MIIGSGFEQKFSESFVNQYGRPVCFYESPATMSEIMLKCDLAIAAGGSTLYELAACGVPAIVFSYAENQIPQIRAMEREGLLQYVGSYQKLDTGNMTEAIKSLQTDYEKRKKLIKRLQSLVDAEGTLRVVQEIELNE